MEESRVARLQPVCRFFEFLESPALHLNPPVVFSHSEKCSALGRWPVVSGPALAVAVSGFLAWPPMLPRRRTFSRRGDLLDF